MSAMTPDVKHKLIAAAFKSQSPCASTSSPPLSHTYLVQAAIKPMRLIPTSGRCPFSMPAMFWRQRSTLSSVGAALLAQDGTFIGGCNVENASYGGTICAERTAITKAVSEGYTSFSACAVVSDIPEPSVSPCGICRQVLREFLPLDTPIYIVSSLYPHTDSSPPSGSSSKEHVIEMTLEQLLPLSFGPDHLKIPRSTRSE
ncbi:cytidine deaminase, partial [Tremellales sp. Uapishka_1]